MNKAFEKILEFIDEQIKIEESIAKSKNEGHPITHQYGANCMNVIKKFVQEVAEEYNGGWIPVKTRPMTEEEKEYYSEYLFEDNGLIYECPLPEDGQEVLVTSKYGSVDKTTFYTDCGNYFENYEDYDEVIAWQPLPEPFKERD